jgi:hypothetical protein
MPADSIVVTCDQCSMSLDEGPNTPIESRKPCPTCGSLDRHVQVSVYDTARVKEKLQLKGRHAVGGKPFTEQVHGDDLERKSGKWMILRRIIDRANDWYHELITDPETGTTVHECKEPLSQHRGHGAAKRVKDDSRDKENR